jgi:hypothetical protein
MTTDNRPSIVQVAGIPLTWRPMADGRSALVCCDQTKILSVGEQQMVLRYLQLEGFVACPKKDSEQGEQEW